MSRAIDWDGMIAELEEQKATAVAAIDQKIAAVRLLAGENGNGSGKAKGKKPPIRPSFGRSDPDWQRGARAMFERGERVSAIAKAVKKSEPTIYSTASRMGWKRPPGPGVKASAARMELPGNVRCPSCESMTKFDPCEHCGKKVRR